MVIASRSISLAWNRLFVWAVEWVLCGDVRIELIQFIAQIATLADDVVEMEGRTISKLVGLALPHRDRASAVFKCPEDVRALVLEPIAVVEFVAGLRSESAWSGISGIKHYLQNKRSRCERCS